MGCKTRNADRFGIRFHYLPDNFFAHDFTEQLICAIHRPEYVPRTQPGRSGPCINRNFDPRWHRRRTHPAVFADQVNDAPAAIALLKVSKRERGNLGPAETAAEEDSQNGAVAQPT